MSDACAGCSIIVLLRTAFSRSSALRLERHGSSGFQQLMKRWVRFAMSLKTTAPPGHVFLTHTQSRRGDFAFESESASATVYRTSFPALGNLITSETGYRRKDRSTQRLVTVAAEVRPGVPDSHLVGLNFESPSVRSIISTQERPRKSLTREEIQVQSNPHLSFFFLHRQS